MSGYHDHRKTTRRTARRRFRRLTRGCLRGRRRAPDDFSQALTAFRKAIRAHRRLARLAPSFFDAAVVDRAAFDRAERRRCRAIWQPILAKVYGCEPEPNYPEPDDRALPPPPTQRAVERWLAEQNLWMDAGRVAFARHQRRYPQGILSLPRLVQLLRLARQFQQVTRSCAPLSPPAVAANGLTNVSSPVSAA